MQRVPKSSLFKRLVLAVTLAVGLAGGVSFALLQSSPGVLKGSTIQTALANLQVSPNGTTYTSQMDGYNFANLVPGGQPSPMNGYPVYLKNVGTTPLAVKLSIHGPISNPDNVDLSKVHLILSPTSGGVPQNLTLQDLINAYSSGGVAVGTASHMIPTQINSFTMQISLDSDAINGPSANLSNIDFNFGAVAVS